MTDIKLCKDCAYFEKITRTDIDLFYRCRNKKTERTVHSFSLVNGRQVEIETKSCTQARRDESGCGSEAKYFELRTPRKSLWQRMKGWFR